MTILSSLMGGGVTSIIKEVGSIVDNLNTSPEEKMKFKTELEEVFNERLQINKSNDINLRSEISKRWSSDAESDVSLAKLIRPVTLMLWTVILIGIMISTIFLDIKEGQLETLTIWMPLIQTIVITIYAAYFGGRSLEKIMHTNRQTKEVSSAFDYIKTVDTTNILKSPNSSTSYVRDLVDSKPNNNEAINNYLNSKYSNEMNEFLGN
jgi:hypothetical protein